MSDRDVKRLQADMQRANDQAKAAREQGWTALAEHFERAAVEIAVRLSGISARYG